jgi:hypothetical protein
VRGVHAVRITFDWSTIEDGRYVVRTAGVDVPEGAFLRQLTVRAGNDVLLSLPFGLDEYGEDDDDEDDE